MSLVKSSDSVNFSVAYLNWVETLVTTGKEGLADCRALLLAVANVLDQSLDKELKALSVLELFSTMYKERETDKVQTLRACKMVQKNPVARFLARVDLAALPVVKTSLQQ